MLINNSTALIVWTPVKQWQRSELWCGLARTIVVVPRASAIPHNEQQSYSSDVSNLLMYKCILSFLSCLLGTTTSDGVTEW